MCRFSRMGRGLPPITLVCALSATSAQMQFIQRGPKLVGTGADGSPVSRGYSVALSGDGHTAIVGGENDNGGIGAAWIFTRRTGSGRKKQNSSARAPLASQARARQSRCPVTGTTGHQCVENTAMRGPRGSSGAWMGRGTSNQNLRHRPSSTRLCRLAFPERGPKERNWSAPAR